MDSGKLAENLRLRGIPVLFEADYIIGMNSYPGVVIHEGDLDAAMDIMKDDCCTPHYEYISIQGDDAYVSLHCLNFCCSLPTKSTNAVIAADMDAIF